MNTRFFALVVIPMVAILMSGCQPTPDKGYKTEVFGYEVWRVTPLAPPAPTSAAPAEIATQRPATRTIAKSVPQQNGTVSLYDANDKQIGKEFVYPPTCKVVREWFDGAEPKFEDLREIPCPQQTATASVVQARQLAVIVTAPVAQQSNGITADWLIQNVGGSNWTPPTWEGGAWVYKGAEVSLSYPGSGKLDVWLDGDPVSITSANAGRLTGKKFDGASYHPGG